MGHNKLESVNEETILFTIPSKYFNNSPYYLGLKRSKAIDTL